MAFLLGTGLAALGLQFLQVAGLITGQTAGLAVLISYLSGWGFGAVFFVVNLPFYVIAITRMGARFTIKTVIAVALVSGFAELFPHWMTLGAVHPILAAFLGGSCIGMGLLAIFRHGASLGGIGILAYWMQDRLGWRAGWVQLAFDGVLFAVAALVLDPLLVGLSLLGAVATNLIVGVNHRRDRYIGL